MATQKTAEELAALAAKGAPATESKLLTQEEVNAIVGKVRQEERGKFSDHEELKTKAGKFDELQKEKLTTEERLRGDLAKEQRRAADAEARVASATIDSQIRVRAVESGFINPAAALRLVNRDGIKYTEDGGVTGVEEALAALKVSDPYLIGAGRPAAPNLNPAPGKPGQSRALTEDQRDAARRMHMTDEEYAKGLKTA